MDLASEILVQLAEKPGQKAREIATKLGIVKKEVNSCLYGKLRGQVYQDKSYKWFLVKRAKKDKSNISTEPEKKIKNTPLAKLCRYYLECLSIDNDQGISVFAENKYGTPDYIELSKFPVADPNFLWQAEEGVNNLLGKTRQDRSRKTLYIGYPVRLRYHRTQRWEGYFVEPIFLFTVENNPDQNSSDTRISDDLPIINFKTLRHLTEGGSSNVLEEVVELVEELGMNNDPDDIPESDELLQRLQEIRPDWDWQDKLNPYSINSDNSLSELTKQGIYNKAIVIIGERSPYTQGLETELKKLSELDDSAVNNTCLGNWLNSEILNDEEKEVESTPLIEVLPLNTEQREAIKKSLTESLTIITGPPGTGKSQVVTELLVNAAWRGQKVLFASKNNKAVDVVEARVNGLGTRPILLRMGSNEYQGKLITYLTNLLSSTASADDQSSYEENFQYHRNLLDESEKLQSQINETMELRNSVDKLERSIVSFRESLAQDVFKQWRTVSLHKLKIEYDKINKAFNNCIKENQNFLTKIFWGFVKNNRFENLEKCSDPFCERYNGILLGSPSQSPCEETITLWKEFIDGLEKDLASISQTQKYFKALEQLKNRDSFEDVARKQMFLNGKMADNSQQLWSDWIKLQPNRLSPEDRKSIGNYAAILQIMINSHGTNKRVPRKVYAEYYRLLPKISHLMPCWAVTSLSANGKIPFEGSFFDLLVIDEASQCDIASAMPLLYRAKRAVVIGDPNQLQHISTLNANRDAHLQDKHGIVEGSASWMYSINSLYHLASSLAKPEDIIILKDHHRSHSDIITFSNQYFYESELRIATRYDRLKLIHSDKPAVKWQNINGQAERPATGGALNRPEAKALIDSIKDLVVNRKYEGTIGVVSPFRSQANLIREMVYKDDILAAKLLQSEFISDTVHKFQGDERDVIFFSPVVSNGIGKGAVAFLKNNGNLFNVAITRARSMLNVVGDFQAALNSNIGYLSEFAKYSQAIEEKEIENDNISSMDFGADYPEVARPELVSDWERIFYHELYSAGVKSIPQYNVEQYILDFALFNNDRKLNVEIDGERYHRSWNGELCRRDQLRNQRLIELGWEVKRFWVYQIRDEMTNCINWVKQWINEK